MNRVIAAVVGALVAGAEGTLVAGELKTLEYVEADGTGYVDTGFVCNREDWDYRLDAELTNNGLYGGSNCRLEFLANEGRGRRTVFRLTCVKDVRNMFINGVDQEMPQGFGEKQTGHAILILTYGRGAKPGVRDCQSGKIYGFELYRDGRLVQKLVPSLDADGVACFADTVSGKAFYASKKDALKPGPVRTASSKVVAFQVPKPQPPAPPAVVDVDCGRQLFVDDWVIARTNGVVRHWNAPTKLEDPIVTPTSEKGGRVGTCTVATDGGLWWDPKIRKYRLWYETDWCGTMRYAESADGLSWEYPDLGVVKGSNQLFEKCTVDTFCVFPDYTRDDPYSQWNLFVSDEGCHSLADTLYVSADGKHFTSLGVAGGSGDRSSMYYDPFRRKWVWSLRCYWNGRSRRYADSDTFAVGKPGYSSGSCERWSEIPSGNLYSFTAVPYESLMVGAMELLGDIPWMKHGRGDNGGCADAGLPKQTRLQFSFSRDGRAYAQGGRACGLEPSGWGSGKWDTGYLSAVGGLFVIRDEKLWIYYSALRGDATRNEDTGVPDGNDNGMYLNGSIGAATLRRDGFAGMVADGEGEIVTRPLRFTGAHLFVNAECRFGSVRAEVLDEKGAPVPGYALADCMELRYADTTKRELVFRGGDLAKFGDRKVSVRFKLTTATLYSFWISPSVRGESRGYVAAGGPAYRGLKDL